MEESKKQVASALSEQTNTEAENDKYKPMFDHKSKLSSLVPEDKIKAYQRLFYKIKELQTSGELPTHPTDEYLGGSELASDIYKKKYFLKDLDNKHIETRPEDMFRRLSAYIAAIETDPAKQDEYAKRFYKNLYKGYFLPGGRVIAGAGDLYRLKTLANCFVSIVERDNIESIYKAAYECARTYSYGGGIGVDISVLRPQNSVVHNAADFSTGAVSFMEVYSLTTGLIGQSGRRGALMLTLDVKHPDVFNFIHVKKASNWVTKQIAEQCRWSGKFDEDQIAVVEKQVRENTQVRFANISLKVSDEFMQAVDEQTTHGKDKIIVYKKATGLDTPIVQDETSLHYSFNIPSKNIEEYQKLGVYDTIEDANKALTQFNVSFTSQDLEDPDQRDIFGDLILPSSEGQLAVKKTGDFMLYFHSQNVGEIKELVKARDIWDPFVAGNYTTAEPGLIFWSTMTKYSPSNYVGKPVISTNPCIVGSSLVPTQRGLEKMEGLVHQQSTKVLTDNRVHLEIPNGDSILQLKQKSGMALDTIQKAWSSGIKDTYKIITKKGYELTATKDHKIRTKNGWKELKNLDKDDQILIQRGSGVWNQNDNLPITVVNTYKGLNKREYRFNFPKKWSKELGELLGWIVGDGFLTENPDNRVGLIFGKGDDKILETIQHYVENIYQKSTKISKRESSTQLRYHSKFFANYLRSLGVKSVKASKKEVPSTIFTATKEAVKGFLRGLFSADGTISLNEKKGNYIRLTSKSKKLLKQVQILLLNCGMLSKLYCRHRSPSTKFTYTTITGKKKDYVNDGKLWELQLNSKSAHRYLKEIGFMEDKHANKIQEFLRAGYYKEHCHDTMKYILPCGKQEVFDLTEPRTHSFIANGIVISNCGEVPLEDGGACNLSSINLSRLVIDGYSPEAKIDWDTLKEVTYDVTRFLDSVVVWNETLNPLEKQRAAASETKRLGLGVMGIADMFNQLGIGYDDPKGFELLEKITKFIANHSYRASAQLSEEKGPSPIYNYEQYSKNPFFQESLDEETRSMIKEKGLRNIAILSIAPTGTISNVVLGFTNKEKHYVGVSGGIEPIFALSYDRRSESFGNKIFKVFHATVQAYLDMTGKTEEAKLAKDDEELMKILPAYFFRTAHYISPETRVKIQGIAQKYIDHSISSTVNLPESIDPETISQVYLQAWKNKLKGITIYRDGSRYPILSVQEKQSEFQEIKDKLFTVGMGKKDPLTLKGNEVFTTPDGVLSTPFHASSQNIPGVTVTPLSDTIDKTETKENDEDNSSDESKVCKVEFVDGQLVKSCSD